jgi:formylmethanofuran dehydrogenase subunit E|tara:strand:+ start:531 stop:692 length:162 start_codon:yes stop_codon:yes gene_type:complete
MVKFAEAEARRFRNVFICKKCKKKIRAQSLKVLAGKISCKSCGYDKFRPVRKK